MSDYTVTFEKGSPSWRLYQKLKQGGVKDSDLDVGYAETDYVKKERKTTGKDDHKIQKQEVLDYALENYERYQLAINETTGYVVPWSLDDLDPATTFDEKIRNKIKQAISFFKDELKKAGYKEGTDRYQELLALCLFAFALTPTNGDLSKIIIPEEGKIEAERLGLIKEGLSKGLSFVFVKKHGGLPELEEAGLKEISSYLCKHGGLGIIEMEEDCELEATALEALGKGCGQCTEKSAVLYALFEMAGLKVDFVHGIPSYDSYKELKWEAGILHISLGLFLNRRIRFFDPAIISSSAETFYQKHFNWWFPITNREFLGGHYNDLGATYGKKDEWDSAIEEFKKALEINPNDAKAHNNLGYAYGEKGELDLAIEEFKKALEINPNDAEAHISLGYTYGKKGELDLAIEEYKKVLEINPNYAKAHYNLGATYGKKDEWDSAIEEFKKALEINPNDAEAHNNLGVAYSKKGKLGLEKGKLDEAIEDFSECLKIFPDKINDLADFIVPTLKEKWQASDELKKIEESFSIETGRQLEIAVIETFFIVAASLWKAGMHEEARERLQIILDVLDFKEKPSSSTKDFFEKMFKLLPEEMKKDEKVKEILKGIKTKLD